MNTPSKTYNITFCYTIIITLCKIASNTPGNTISKTHVNAISNTPGNSFSNTPGNMFSNTPGKTPYLQFWARRNLISILDIQLQNWEQPLEAPRLTDR